jgi:NAD(P)H-dependent FMN reductase
MALSIAVLYGSVRSERQGIKAARFIVNKLEARGIETTLVDPLENPLPLLDKMYKEYPKGEAPSAMEVIAETLERSDAFVVVTGEYNHSVPPALKNLLDHFQTEYFFKPAAIASYSAGNFGGVRAATQLRVILGELGMPTISTMFPMSKVQSSFDDEGVAQIEMYDENVCQFLDELAWYAEALKNKRAEGTPF